MILPLLSLLGKPTKKKKNSVRVHVATTTQESVKPFHYKRQGNMEFCLGESYNYILITLDGYVVFFFSCGQVASLIELLSLILL